MRPSPLRADRRSVRVAAAAAEDLPGKSQTNLITSPSFVVDKFKVSRAWQFQRPRHTEGSVWCLVATAGCGVIEGEGAAPVTFAGGEAVVVPAEVERFMLRPQWEVEFLCSSLPVEGVEHPKTILSENAAGTAL